VSQGLNETLKDWIREPRPDASFAPLKTDTAPGFGFPSGHAQNSTVVWGMLAALLRRPWLWGLAVLLPLLIGFSRLYLGLHWPIDVVGGWVIGAIIVGAALALVQATAGWIGRAVPPLWLGGLSLLPLLLVLVDPSENNAKIAGSGLGLIWGWWLERRMVGFVTTAPLAIQVVKFAIGLAVIFTLRLGLKPVLALLPLPVLPDVLRYTIIGLWMVWLAPWLFMRLFGRYTAAPTTAEASA
jgi:hypothetical protein